MKTVKMSLANIQGKLSRSEMKNIMAGSGGGHCWSCTSNQGSSCWYVASNDVGAGFFTCNRVYPNASYLNVNQLDSCGGCTMH
jgi:hypothetical protein